MEVEVRTWLASSQVLYSGEVENNHIAAEAIAAAAQVISLGSWQARYSVAENRIMEALLAMELQVGTEIPAMGAQVRVEVWAA